MKFALIVLIAISMSGCGESSKIQEAIRASLIDSDSAKFGKMSLVKNNKACMTVNSKNSMGGYTGDQQALLKKSENKWEVLDITSLFNHEQCIDFLSEYK